jgi:hypothetical protein
MTNVKLSIEELALVTNAELILTKNRIIQKVYELFGELSEEYKVAGNSFDETILSVPPKISKGENYLGLPWVMLDYPRRFSKTDVFAIRTFFWWGNFFSITLQLQGIYQERFSAVIKDKLNKQDWWLCTDTSDAWQHHFDTDHYSRYDGTVELSSWPFIKLAKKIPLQEWDNSFDFLSNTFKEIAEVLSTQPVK